MFTLICKRRCRISTLAIAIMAFNQVGCSSFASLSSTTQRSPQCLSESFNDEFISSISSYSLISNSDLAVATAESYSWNNAAIGGMGFVTGIVIHPADPNVVYARTDVGGLYRWQADSLEWVQLMDGMRGYYSIESVALDPNQPDRVYVAAGNDILVSSDRGTTWEPTPLLTDDGQPAHMNGNGQWRWAGERLAVDSQNSDVVYFGSRLDGLYVTRDGSSTWQRVDSFPAVGNPPGGITFVQFAPNSQDSTFQVETPFQTLYIGVMGEGVYTSDDGGQSWELMTGGPNAEQIPQQAVVGHDETLYVTTFTTPEQPNGAVWKYLQGQWQEMTPRDERNYSAIAIDPQDSQTLIVGEYPLSPEGLHRTTDGGNNWQTVQLDVETIEWWPDWHLYTLIGGLAINPQQPQQTWLSTGFGVMRTEDISQQPSEWCSYMKNLEELVVFVVKSPPVPEGAYFLSGVADMDGFRHTSLTEYPTQTHDNGQFGDTTGMDFSEADPNIIVRVGSSPGSGGREDSQFRSAYSSDNGQTWTPFNNYPTNAVNGKVAVSATLQSNGYPIIVWAPQGDIYPHRSLDGGNTWEPVQGAPNQTTLQLWFASQAVASDRVNGNLFYLYKYNGQPNSGVFYRSTDGGATWDSTSYDLPDSYYHSVKAAPNMEGEVWLQVADSPLLRSSDAGETFTPLAQIEEADVFTFGKAAPGRNHPTVFVSGVVNGVEGLFRSDDALGLTGNAANATWVKVSTESHALGNVTYLEGDRLRFGHIYVGTSGRGILYGQPR